MNKFKYISLITALAIVSACTMEELSLDNEQNRIPEELITLKASREGNPETRTVRDESNGDVLWAPGDAISLFYGSGSNGGSKFTSNATENSKITNFTGTITAITGGGEITPEDTYFWGVYPYNDDVSCDGTTVTMTLPTEQVATPGTFAPNTFPSIGRSQGLIMGFYNICGGWRFSVTKEGVRRVTLKSNGGEQITGKVKVGLNESGVPKIQEIIDGSDEVVIECPRGEYFEVGKNYYMIMLPTVFTSGFTMTFETYTEEGVYNRTAKTTISRSKFSGIANLDNYLTTPYTQKTGNIPVEDANFKAYLVENFDGNGDGEISYKEAQTIQIIDIQNENISSIQGIERMPYLTRITCSNLGLNDIDVSNNTKLINLNYSNWEWSSKYGKAKYYNNVLTIDLSKNTTLKRLICDSNQLTAIDVSKNTALIQLHCSNNQLTAINVSQNTVLTDLACSGNQLTSLDVSKNTALSYLSCFSNQLTALDVSQNIALTALICSSNQLTSLDVSKNTALTDLDCYNNQLTNLDVSKNTALTSLYCYSNQLTNLDVSKNTALTSLYCYNNRLTSLDVSNNTDLKSLTCRNNYLTDLDVSKNIVLSDLYCQYNQLTTLDVSKNKSLNCLFCSNNKLNNLDVSQNTALTKLTCETNQLTVLDVSKNTELNTLSCYSNQLTNLDISKNTKLTSLDCSPMNTLSTLYIYQGQTIPRITTDRDANYIPSATQIVVKPESGGSEGTGDEELNP